MQTVTADKPSGESPGARIAREEAALREEVAAATEAFLADQHAVLHAISPESLALLQAISPLTAGGKKMRALLCYWGWRAAGGSEGGREAVQAAAALEFFQAAALMHDDIIDRSDTRRGAPSAHRQFSAMHAREGLHLDGYHFGISAAILAGDLCLAFSEELFSRACQGDPGRAARAIFNRMRTEVMAGQYLDLLEEAAGQDHSPDVAADRALNILRFKSARYSIERPVMLGAALAGADADLLERLSAFALPLGEAFQLRDDILGVFGDQQITGKPAGDDLREGKRTYLVALTLAQCPAEQRPVVNALLGDPSLGESDIGVLRGIISASGALENTETLITERLASALESLESLGLEAMPAAALRRLATAAVTRSF